MYQAIHGDEDKKPMSNPIENDKWCGDRRIGIIVNGFYDEIKDNEV